MATKQEIEEVRAFLSANDNEWTSNEEIEEACPSLLHRKKCDDDVIVYHVNSVVVEAGMLGGIEEHGYDDFLCVAMSQKP